MYFKAAENAMKLFVGNLPYSATEEELTDLFGQHGEVVSVKIIMDRETNRSRGFGFVEMSNGEEAIKQLNGLDMNGRNLVVKEAQEREKRPSRNFNNNNRNRSFRRDY